jgi:hypothetical protein
MIMNERVEIGDRDEALVRVIASKGQDDRSLAG